MPPESAAFQAVVDGFIGNPFDTPRAVRDRAAGALAELDIAATLQALLARGEIEQAKLLALSVAHAQACDNPNEPETILDATTLPSNVARRLPRPAGDYRRIAAAAGRCYAALDRIRGTSSLLHQVRRDTWAACFGQSLRHVLELERVVRDHDVLILGETGTGKEAIARAIQVGTPGGSDGAPAPSSAVNAAAIPATLVESELFGHIKGSFTGATETRAGRLRSANGGSFFLDEAGDLPKTTQVKFLRVIETDEVFPVGSDSAHSVDIRYIAATHKDLERLVVEGKFRRDLFQRLAGNVIRIAPLRERPEDIVEIGLSFASAYVSDGEQLTAIRKWLAGKEARTYSWPGNVRELQNALRNLMLGLDAGLVSHAAPAQRTAADVPAAIAKGTATMQAVSDWYLRRVLDGVSGNYTKAAQILGLDRSTVRRRAG